MDKITLLLVDDHAMVRRGLRLELAQAGDFEVVAEAGSVEEAVEQASQHHPQVAVIDIQLGGDSGIEACRHIAACCPATAVLMLTAFDWDVYLAQAWAAGAAGFVVKAADFEELVRAIRQAAAGWRLWTAEQVRRIRAWNEAVGEKLKTLTAREWEVLRLLAKGMGNKQIARTLKISENTVEKHVGAVLGKLGVASRQDLEALARQHRLEV